MGLFKKQYTGFTDKTVENIQLDAGAFFKNFDMETDTYASARTEGKLIGATQGGGEFSAKPTFRQIAIDGVKGRAKGLADIDTWEVYIKATVLEVNKDTLLMALGCGEEDTSGSTDTHYKLVGHNSVVDTDYIDNITWVGKISGQENPIVIQVFNALNEDGLTLTVADKAEGKITLNFYGYNSVADIVADTIEPPFAIWMPYKASGTGE